MSRSAARPPLYVRALRLRRLRPSSLVCFLLLEGMIAVGVLLALAELVSWWAVLALPAAMALMVKLNDLIVDRLALAAPAPPAKPGRHAAEAVVPAQSGRVGRHVSRDLSDTLDPVDSPRQQFRQSARRRYE